MILKGYNSFMRAIVPPDEGSYSYAGIGYANPHAVTQIANGLSTTTYSYDQNGNLTQKTTDGITTPWLGEIIELHLGGLTNFDWSQENFDRGVEAGRKAAEQALRKHKRSERS